MDATNILSLDDTHCYMLESKFTEMCGSKITSVYTSFNGVHLSITSLTEEITSENVSSLTYTIKEINSATDCRFYTSVAICQPLQMLMVQEVWSKAFVATDLMFFADSDVKQGNDSALLIPCVKIVIFGFFSPMDETITKEHFHFTTDERRMNFLRGSTYDLSTYVIENFSFTGTTVLDMSNLDGIPSEVAVKMGRNSICVTEEKDLCAVITARLSKNLNSLHI